MFPVKLFGTDRFPTNVVFSVCFLIGFVMYLKMGAPKLAPILWYATAFCIPYSLWTILYYICRRWPKWGLFICLVALNLMGGRRYRRW